MLFTHSQARHDDIQIRLGDRTINQVKSIKFLGIHIDNRLSFNDHIANLARKLSQTIGIMYKMSSFVPSNILKMIYFSLFYPHLIYGISIWGGCGSTNVGKLVKLQQRALSLFVNGTYYGTPLPYNSVYLYFLLCQFQKYLFHNRRPYFVDKIIELVPKHSHSTRFNLENRLNIPFYNKSVNQNQFLYNAVDKWNSIPTDLKTLMPTHIFKRKLMRFLRGAEGGIQMG